MTNNQSGSSDKSGDPKDQTGNFANDQEKASDAAKKGGHASSGRGARRQRNPEPPRADNVATEAAAVAKKAEYS